MLRYSLKRLMGLIPRIVLISALLFLLIQLPKGGPADIYAADPSASPASLERIKELWGLNRPLHVQYLSWIRNLLSGDWGMSFAERRPARTVVVERIGNTVWLTGAALLIALIGGLLLGTLAALSRSRVVKSLVQIFAVIGMSIPTFWSGSLVLLFFAVYLGWIPSGGHVHHRSALFPYRQILAFARPCTRLRFCLYRSVDALHSRRTRGQPT